jgi:hypothetical protein
MSEENVEIVRGMYRPGDPTGFFGLLDEDVEVDVSRRPLVPDHPALIRGKQAAIEFYAITGAPGPITVLSPTKSSTRGLTT